MQSPVELLNSGNTRNMSIPPMNRATLKVKCFLKLCKTGGCRCYA